MNKITICIVGAVLSMFVKAGTTWSISPTTKTIPAAGGTFTLSSLWNEYTGPADVFYSAPQVDWITKESMTSVSLGQSVKIIVKPNMTSSERCGQILCSVNDHGASGLRSCWVTQAGQNVQLCVSPIEVEFESNGGVVDINVTAASGDMWEVLESIDWLSANVQTPDERGL